MSDRPVKEETRTDYVGPYQAYIYADGHVETDPPGRPMTKEDLQRQRLQEFAASQMTSYAARITSLANPAGTPADLARARSVTMDRSMLLRNFEETQEALAILAQTGRSALPEVDTLIHTASNGGPING